MNPSRPQTRQIHEHGQARNRPQLRLIRVHEQSAAKSSPGQRPQEQSVNIRGNYAASIAHDRATATDTDTPQTEYNSTLAATAASSLTDIMQEPHQAKGCPIRHITVDILPPVSFPVHVRHNPAYVLL